MMIISEHCVVGSVVAPPFSLLDTTLHFVLDSREYDRPLVYGHVAVWSVVVSRYYWYMVPGRLFRLFEAMFALSTIQKEEGRPEISLVIMVSLQRNERDGESTVPVAK